MRSTTQCYTALALVMLLCAPDVFAASGYREVSSYSRWGDINELTDDALAELTETQGILPGPHNQLTRVRALLSQSQRSIYRSYEAAERFLQLASPLIQTGSAEAAVALALRCQIDYRQGVAGAANHCEALAAQTEQVTNQSALAFVYLTQAIYLTREGRHEEAKVFGEKSVTAAATAQDKRLIAIANNWLGVHYSIKRLPKLALLHYESAWEHAEGLESPELGWMVQFNLAAVLPVFGRHAEALAIFNKAINWSTSTMDETRRVVYYALKAIPLIATNQAALAEQELLAVVPGLFDHVPVDTRVHAYNALAQTQLAQDKLDAALGNFERAIALFDEAAPETNPRIYPVLVPYAETLGRLNQHSAALTTISRVVTQLNNDTPNNLLRDALLVQAKILNAAGAEQQAMQAASRAQAVSDQLDSEALQYQVARLENSIELERSRRQLADAREREFVLQAEAERESALRYLTLTLGALLLFVGYLLFSRHMHSRLAQSERAAKARLEDQVRERTEQLEEQMAERLQAEVERRDLLSKLADGEKMRALGQLTAGVAHDFNNLMTAVTLTTQYLKNTPENAPEAREALLDDILSATDSAARITGGLLAYARQQPLQPRTLQLDEFLEESTLIFRNSLGERNLLRTTFEPCRVTVDQGQLTSALLNLLLNAKEAIGERGFVEIKLTAEHNDTSPTGMAVITVKDSGRGMSEAELQRAIDPFYTSKPAGEGAGLGLSMVYGFARQSGGDLKLTSTPERGTTAELRLPLEAKQDLNESISTLTPVTRLPRGLNVLVVEDRDSVLQMLMRSLAHLGLQPTSAVTTDDAIALLQDGYQPDLLLSDVLTPGEMDGQALAEFARQQAPSLPIVLMSGYTESVDQAYEFLRKPFSMGELEQALLQALQRTDAQAERLTAHS